MSAHQSFNVGGPAHRRLNVGGPAHRSFNVGEVRNDQYIKQHSHPALRCRISFNCDLKTSTFWFWATNPTLARVCNSCQITTYTKNQNPWRFSKPPRVLITGRWIRFNFSAIFSNSRHSPLLSTTIIKFRGSNYSKTPSCFSDHLHLM